MDDFSEFGMDFRSQFLNQDFFSFLTSDPPPACQTATCEQPPLQTGALIELGVPTTSPTVFDTQSSNWNMINECPEPKSLYHQEVYNHHKNIERYHYNVPSPDLIPPPPYRPPNGFDLESVEYNNRKTPPPPYSLANKHSRTELSDRTHSARDNTNNNLMDMDNFQSLDNFCGQFELNRRINNFQKGHQSNLQRWMDSQNLNFPHQGGDSPDRNASGFPSTPPGYDSRNLTPSPLSDAAAWTDPDSPLMRRDGSSPDHATADLFLCGGEGAERRRSTTVPTPTVEDAGEDGGWGDDARECMSEGKCFIFCLPIWNAWG